MSQLLKKIEDNINSFAHRPVGPIGKYLKLNEGCSQWAKAVEILLGCKRGDENKGNIFQGFIGI